MISPKEFRVVEAILQEAGLEGGVLVPQTAQLQGSAHPVDQPFLFADLGVEVVGPEFHALDRGFDQIEAGEDDYRQGGVFGHHPAQEFLAGEMGHGQIQDQQAELLLVQKSHDLSAVAFATQVVDPGRTQSQTEAVEPTLFVVHQEDRLDGVDDFGFGHFLSQIENSRMSFQEWRIIK